MKLHYLLSFAFIMCFLISLPASANSSNGIEPVLMEEMTKVDPPEDTKVEKTDKYTKKGFLKAWSWVKEKADKALGFFGLGSSSGNFSIVGFLLGFFLSLLGVLLAYLFLDNVGAKSAWIGFAIGVVLWLLVVFI